MSAFGHGIPVLHHGRVVKMDGTSASSPIVAAILSLINEKRVRENHPPLGFVNPLLYSMQKASSGVYRDIVDGNNACGNHEQRPCCKDGYSASEGWDPVTGLGAILYSEFIQADQPQEIAPLLSEFVDYKRSFLSALLCLIFAVGVIAMLKRHRRVDDRDFGDMKRRLLAKE